MTTIVLEGPQWQCQTVMSLDRDLGGFSRTCADDFSFLVITDEHRRAAKAAIEALQAACPGGRGRK